MSIKIALAGNPNCGKTTLFNALTGSNQFVGNWPGVTVEKKEGKLKGHKDVTHYGLTGYLFPVSIHTGGSGCQKLSDQRTSGCDSLISLTEPTLERNLYLSTQVRGTRYSGDHGGQHDGYRPQKSGDQIYVDQAEQKRSAVR